MLLPVIASAFFTAPVAARIAGWLRAGGAA